MNTRYILITLVIIFSFPVLNTNSSADVMNESYSAAYQLEKEEALLPHEELRYSSPNGHSAYTGLNIFLEDHSPSCQKLALELFNEAICKHKLATLIMINHFHSTLISFL